jgi:hypothetical protein
MPGKNLRLFGHITKLGEMRGDTPMKRNKALRIAAILMALVLVSTMGMVGTLARYTTDFDIESRTVRAGLFRVTGPADLTTAVSFTRLQGDGDDDENVLAYGAGTSNLGGSTGEDILVPGSIVRVDGPIEIRNLSEVAVRISLDSLALAAGSNANVNYVVTPAVLAVACDCGASCADEASKALGCAMIDAVAEVTANATMPLMYSTGGTIGDTASWNWSSTIPALNNVLSLATTGNVPASLVVESDGTIILPAQSGVAMVNLDLYILWPFVNAAPLGADGVTSANSDAADTAIGLAQANALLTGAGDAFVTNAATPSQFNLELTINAVQID